MGKSNLIAALNNATIYNCKVCFNPFTAKRPKRTKDKFIGNIYTLVSVLSIRGLHVSKSGKSICCEVEYSDSNNETNITKLYVTFNDDKTVLILHSNNNTWGIISTDYKYISDPINDTENV